MRVFQLYIEYYLIWMQSRASTENLQQLAKNAKHIKITKASLGLDLDVLEKAALLVMEDGDMGSSILKLHFL
jgi:predicted subunit of tRNA(5-methylaminomethyl-2-thiouridylate) methyltransferase